MTNFGLTRERILFPMYLSNLIVAVKNDWSADEQRRCMIRLVESMSLITELTVLKAEQVFMRRLRAVLMGDGPLDIESLLDLERYWASHSHKVREEESIKLEPPRFSLVS